MFNRKTIVAALLILIVGIPASQQPRPTAVLGQYLECFEDGSGIMHHEDGTTTAIPNQQVEGNDCYIPELAD